MTLLFLGNLGAGEILIILFYIGGFAFLNGKIAKGKGYPFLAGAITGIIAFLGTILFMIMPSRQKKKKERDIKQQSHTSGIKKCPYCGEEIAVVAKKCKHCREWLTEQLPQKTKVCPCCAETIEESDTVCPHCKESLVEQR
jgi:hypothetical protein